MQWFCSLSKSSFMCKPLSSAPATHAHCRVIYDGTRRYITLLRAQQWCGRFGKGNYSATSICALIDPIDDKAQRVRLYTHKRCIHARSDALYYLQWTEIFQTVNLYTYQWDIRYSANKDSGMCTAKQRIAVYVVLPRTLRARVAISQWDPPAIHKDR